MKHRKPPIPLLPKRKPVAKETPAEKLGIKLLSEKRQMETVGTGLSGYINCPYKKLVELLGKPNNEGDGYKVDAEWAIEMNGKILTIYNYRDGINYNGASNGLDTEDITEWHIGSREKVNKEILALQKTLNPKKESKIL